MRDKFYRFMQGRYGVDQLSKFLMILGLILVLFSSFFPTSVFTLLFYVVVVYAYYRIFSRNHQKRVKENQWYLSQKNKATYFLENFKNRKNIVTAPKKDKNNHIYKCPKCKQKIRVPKGKGKIEISCRKCGHKFIKKS